MIFPSRRASNKEFLENMIAKKRAQEIENLEKWQYRAEHLRTSTLRAIKEKQWTSDECYASSMQAFDAQNSTNYCAVLDRRERLRSLLNSESKHQKDILDVLAAETKNKEPSIPLVNSSDKFRDWKREKTAEDLLCEDFRSIDHDVGSIMGRSAKNDSVPNMEKQLNEKSTKCEQDRTESIVLQEAESEQLTKSVSLDKQQEHLRILHSQLNELQKREEEAKKLSVKEDALMHDLVRLEELERDLKVIEERCKRELHGRALLRQHSSALRRRSNAIQDELEAELEWLDQLKNRAAKQFHPTDAQLEHGIQKARQMLEADLARERKQELELDTLYAHEAAKLWYKREGEWQQETESRQRLLNQVLEEIRNQVDEQLGEVRAQQKRELEASEALLEKLAKQKDDTTLQAVRTEESRRAVNEELDTQVNEKKSAVRQTWEQPKYEQLVTSKAEAAYEELLRQETEKLRIANDSALTSKSRNALPPLSLRPGGNIW